MPTTGPTSRTAVSIQGGSSAATEKIQRKKKSGLGTVWMIVGSGSPLGPKGPKIAAHATTASTSRPENTRSFRNATGKNGTPSSCTSLAYSAS